MSTPDLRIQQAVVLVDARGVRVAAATDGFDAPEAERIAVLFGIRPPGVVCPLAHFACPFGRAAVAAVRVEDRPNGYLGFRFLVLAADLYRHLGDPFAISDRFPPDWAAAGTLPDLAWPAVRLPERTVGQLDAILRAGDGPFLLGATQAIVDGNRVLVARREPAEKLVRDLWQLLPDRSRAALWPASFAFSDELRFHLAAIPDPVPAPGPKPLTEEAAKDYPEGRYEKHLQIAVESGDQAALAKLLARRTADEAMRLALYILAFALLVAVVMRFVP